MSLQKIWLCTSKNSKLNRIYFLHTGDTERTAIFDCFEDDLNRKIETEDTMDKLNGNALIDDIPYYIDFEDIQEESYLHSFKEKVNEILGDNPSRVIQFSRNPMRVSEIRNFEDNEGIKFIIAQSNDALYFLYAPNNSVIKNKSIMSLSITENATVLTVPKGIQIPPIVTAKLDCGNKRLFVYDVNRFESMLTLNENQKAKSREVLNKFSQGEYKISSENYTFSGLDNQEVHQKLSMSKRAIRRLSKYQPSEEVYSINQIKEAVNKLDEDLRVAFDDETKTINVTPNTAKTFVGIIHNSIVQRLISGEIEIAI
ncbi:hypothetical protein [Bacillus cereus]|uniref:hypothetical protein n=1 Tax=Bacillus cereus TaxID=1396 RepID=UPI000B4AB8EF|nr:hypothetical protein [Bacillus cereus]